MGKRHEFLGQRVMYPPITRQSGEGRSGQQMVGLMSFSFSFSWGVDMVGLL